MLAQADNAIIDYGRLTGGASGAVKALDLVGPKQLRDTLAAAEKGGIACRTGLIGVVDALNGFDLIKDIPNGVYLTLFLRLTNMGGSREGFRLFWMRGRPFQRSAGISAFKISATRWPFGKAAASTERSSKGGLRWIRHREDAF